MVSAVHRKAMRAEAFFCGGRAGAFGARSPSGKRSPGKQSTERFSNNLGKTPPPQPSISLAMSPEPKVTASNNPRSPLEALSPASPALNSTRSPVLDGFKLDGSSMAVVVSDGAPTDFDTCDTHGDTARAREHPTEQQRQLTVPSNRDGAPAGLPRPKLHGRRTPRTQLPTVAIASPEPFQLDCSRHDAMADESLNPAACAQRANTCKDVQVFSPPSESAASLDWLEEVSMRQGHVLSSNKECAMCHAQLQQNRRVVLGYDRTFCSGHCRKDFIKAVRKVGFSMASERQADEHTVATSPMGKLVLDEFGVFDVVPMVKRSRSGYLHSFVK
eukprot:SAG31_NODE_1784_length_7279_cov_2.932869_1_plen_330_part_00